VGAATVTAVIKPRSYLYVPGDRAEMLDKAASLGADVVVADLEDGVPADRKGRARDNVADWLESDVGGHGPLRWVRLNAPEDLLADDLEVVRAATDRVDGVSLPKA
jgi:citrate lyase subunit beta / citryl-CoA lyase